MKASRLIEILQAHIDDKDGGGDFEVYVENTRRNRGQNPIERAWLYPGLRRIAIGYFIEEASARDKK